MSAIAVAFNVIVLLQLTVRNTFYILTQYIQMNVYVEITEKKILQYSYYCNAHWHFLVDSILAIINLNKKQATTY